MKRDASGKLFVCRGEMEIPVASFEVVDPLRQVTIQGLPDQLIAATYTLVGEKDGTQLTVTLKGFVALPEAARPVCPQCGARMGPRGQERRTLQTAGGQEVSLERSYVVCPHCKGGFSPWMRS